jgi:hypothetical protein
MKKAPKPTISSGYCTTSRLAELFGLNRKTIAEWRKLGHPVPAKVNGQEDLAAWREYFRANPEAGRADGKPRKDRETLLCEKLEVEIALARTKYEQQLGELVPVGEVRESATRIYSVVRGEFLKFAADLPPRLSGLSEVEISKVLRAEIMGILQNLSDESGKMYALKET